MAKSPRIRRDDVVKVITGKDKGKTGTVKAVEPKKNRVFVEGLNRTTRHQRPRTIRDAQRAGEVGGVVGWVGQSGRVAIGAVADHERDAPAGG